MSRPVHFEIHASDPEKLAKFYADVFGWKIQHMPQFDYWLIDSGSSEHGINGGLLRRRGSPPAPDAPVNAYVCSLGIDSVDSYLERALKAGATVALPKMAIPGVGYQAYIKDPDGNILGLHQPDKSAS
jgi:predicted enzyme related to lactoylglutathione lyase